MRNQLDTRKKREERYRSRSSSSSPERTNEKRIADKSRSDDGYRRKSRFRNNSSSSSEESRAQPRIKREPISDDEAKGQNLRRNKTSRFSHHDHRPDTRPGDSRNRWQSRSKSPVDVKPRPVKVEMNDGEVWGKSDANNSKGVKKVSVDKSKPDFGLSGKLAEETNTYNGVVIKYSEPPEARKPKRRWRLYPFKGDVGLPTLYIHRQSAFLIGRDRKVADLPIDHPSCSKQHAVLQYRLVPYKRPDGMESKRISPYIIDLESANGTFINNKQIDPKKYVQLFEKDVIKFGYSSREYVLLHEHSKDSDEDDNL